MIRDLLFTLRLIADAILGRADEPYRLDTPTAMETDFSSRPDPLTPENGLPPHVDPIEELKRLIGEPEPKPRLKAQTFPRRRERANRCRRA